MFRLREPVCVAAGSLQVGGGGTTGDGVSAVQQVNDELALSLTDYFRRSREQRLYIHKFTDDQLVEKVFYCTCIYFYGGPKLPKQNK